MADLRITELNALLPADVVAQDQLAIADVSASETKKIGAKALGEAVIRLLDNESIPGSKVDLGTLVIDGSDITDDSIPGDALEENSVTTRELAPNAVETENIKNGEVTATKLSDDVAERGLSQDDTTNKIGHANDLGASGSHAGISYDQYGHITAATDLVPATDLPVATETVIGAVSVPSAGGLDVNGSGAVSHSNSVVAGTYAGVTYDAHGHITAVDVSGKVPASDLPVAGDTVDEVGVVYVPATNENPVTVANDGAVTHSQVGTPGTYPKVTVNQYGHVTAGTDLVEADIPAISFDKVTGTLGPNKLGPNVVTAENMADYATSYMQDANPGQAPYLGMLWYSPETAQLNIYARGSNGLQWMPVGYGRLSAENLRWGGLVNASTGLITVLTDIGISAGLQVGMAPLEATDALGGLYLVVDTDGNNINVLPGTAFDSQDWLLCINEAQGWIKVDSAASGGGGGGSTTLAGLLDTEITTPQDGDLLLYNGGDGKWVNEPLTVIDGGTF